MSKHPRLKLSRLRDLGWALWDPIGLADIRASYEDEYDGYLLIAAGMARRGDDEEVIARYLLSAEAELMGLPMTGLSDQRAMSLAKAIFAAKDIWIEPAT